MRKTVYLTLAALGAASIATAAVVTTEAPEEPPRRRAAVTSTATNESRSTASETPSADETKKTKRECRKRCRWFD